LGLGLVASGLILAILGQILPLVRLPQTLAVEGPKVESGKAWEYWIDTMITPPIEAGETLTLTLNASKPGANSILVFPSSSGGDPIGPALISESLPPGISSLKRSLTVKTSANYMISVSSVSSSSYSLEVNSVWPPFQILKTLSLPGVALLLGGAFLYYYWRVKQSVAKEYG